MFYLWRKAAGEGRFRACIVGQTFGNVNALILLVAVTFGDK
jgi:hypothetical protein